MHYKNLTSYLWVALQPRNSENVNFFTMRKFTEYHFCVSVCHSEYLLVTESREERRQWMDELQKQNPKLLEHESESHNTLQVQRHA